MNYIEFDDAINIHDQIIAESGGIQGLRSVDLLKSPLEMIKNDTYYPKMIDKMAFLFYSIIQNHAFVDGNKRSAIILTAYLLLINGADLNYINFFIRGNEQVAVLVAEGKISKDQLIEVWRGIDL